MRVLFVAAPLLGHVFPLVPLARAMRAAGHDVLLATAGDGLAVERSGLPTEDVAPGFAFGPIAGRVLLRRPRLAVAELAGRAGTRVVGPLFAGVNRRIAAGVAATAERYRPDLVVFEPLAIAGVLAAARLGAPAVLHENSLFDGPTLVRVTAEQLPDAPPAPVAAISVAPPSVLGDRPGWPMRAVPYGGEGDVPGRLTTPAARPRVLVSRSTVGPGAGSRLLRAVLAAAPQVDADFVLMRPPPRVAAGRLPANVEATGWLPMPDVLPHAAAVVHHGGAGTTLAALHAGVPQLVTTGAGDRRHNAELIARRGAGLALADREVTAAALTRLISDARLAAAAAEVRAEMAAMPAPEQLVGRLERLAARD